MIVKFKLTRKDEYDLNYLFHLIKKGYLKDLSLSVREISDLNQLGNWFCEYAFSEILLKCIGNAEMEAFSDKFNLEVKENVKNNEA